MKDTYKGWEIKRHPNSPQHTRFSCHKHGCVMRSGSRKTLVGMIDAKEKEAANER